MYEESGPAAKKRRIEVQDSSDEEEEEPECFINMLPDEILMEIFDWLYFVERQLCAVVCRRWHTIMRNNYYMSRTKCTVDHSFGYLVDRATQSLLANCRHIYFNDCGSVPGLVCDNLIPAHQAHDQPGPSTARTGISMEDFLFSGTLPVRWFTVTATSARITAFVAGRLHMMPELEEFAMNVLPPQEEHWATRWAGLDPQWKLEHPRLRSLTVLLYAGPMCYELAVPQLTKLTIEVANDNELRALMRCSEQLEDLWVLFYFPRGMEQTLTYPFPRLKKLTMKRYGVNDPPDPNTRVDDASAERFVRSAPLLEDVTLRFNVVTMRMLRAVCVIGESSVTRLSLTHCVLPRRLFVFITELKKLEFLKLKNCALEDDDRPLREVDFPRLKQLILINSGTCIRIDDGLSGVTHFKYTVDPKLSKVCRHMWQLEDFEIKLRAQYPVAEFVRDHFHSLPRLAQLQTLRLSGIKTTNRPWDFCRPMPAVEHLVLRKCHLVRREFSKLPKLFPSLRLLELTETRIAYKRCPDGVNPLVHFTARLKQFFPSCRVVVDPQSSAIPLATILEMEDEFRWQFNRARAAGVVIQHVCPVTRAKWAAKRQRAKQRQLEQEEREARLEQADQDASDSE